MASLTAPREDIVEILKRNAEATGLGLRRFYELGKEDRLDDPLPRDLWLVWGDVLTEDDLPPAAWAGSSKQNPTHLPQRARSPPQRRNPGRLPKQGRFRGLGRQLHEAPKDGATT